MSEDSPAADAGLQVGDIVVAYRGKAVKELGSFRNRVSLTPPGTKAELTILRNGKRQDVTVTIGTLSGKKTRVKTSVEHVGQLGLSVQTLTPELAEQLGIDAKVGVVVTQVEPDSVAARAGIESGVVILQVNRRSVASAAEFARAMDLSRDKRQVLLLVRRGEAQQFVVPSPAPAPGSDGRRTGRGVHSRPDDVGAASAPRVRSFRVLLTPLAYIHVAHVDVSRCARCDEHRCLRHPGARS